MCMCLIAAVIIAVVSVVSLLCFSQAIGDGALQAMSLISIPVLNIYVSVAACDTTLV